MDHEQNVNEQNFYKLIVGCIGETLSTKISRKIFDKLLTIRQICQNFPPLNFCAIATVAISA